MAEYRRFIAYIYEYTNGKKNKNTGFAKVESRNGICRMQVHLQNIPQEENSLNVYGFVRKGEWLLGIFLGSAAVQGQMGDAKIATPADKIGDTGYRLDQLAGLWVEGGFGRKYITQFDEGKVDTEKLVTELPNLRAELEAVVETVQEPALSPEAVNDAENLTWERMQPKADPAPENGSDGGAKPVLESKWEPGAGLVSEESLDGGMNLTSESVQPAADETAEEMQDSGENREAEDSAEAERKVEMFGDNADAGQDGQPEPDLHTDGIDSEDKSAPEVKAASKEQPLHTQAAAACPHSYQQCQQCQGQQNCQSGFDQRWQCMSKRYPHFQPFPDDEIADCIQIMPKDLRLLQQGNWRTGNNSFLMHGYYNYRHLLLGKKKEGGYILGIPGLYENQELFMANMFGFPDFKDAPGQKKTGRFGYWCRTLS